MAKENKYLFAGLAFIAAFILAVIVEPFRHLPQAVVVILYAALTFPGFTLIYLARREMVKVVEELRPVRPKNVHVADTKADRNWRIAAVGTGVVGSALAYLGHHTIMHTSRVLPSVLGWVVFCVGMMMVGVAFVLRKFADL